MSLEDKLKQKAKEEGFSVRELNECICNVVEDAKFEEADAINRRGIKSQIKYLRKIHLTPPMTKVSNLDKRIIENVLSLIGQSS